MPYLSTENLQVKVLSEKNELSLAIKQGKAEPLDQDEVISMNENTYYDNHDVPLITQQTKPNIVSENKQSQAYENRNNYNKDVSLSIQPTKLENTKENQQIYVEKNVNDGDTDAREKPWHDDLAVENTPSHLEKPEKNDDKSTDIMSRVLVITVKSSVTQIGGYNRIMLQDDKKEREELRSAGIQETASRKANHTKEFQQTKIFAVEIKKIPTPDINFDSYGEKSEVCGNVNNPETSEESDLHMQSIKTQRLRVRKRNLRARKNSKMNKNNTVLETVQKNLAPASPSDSMTELWRISDDVMLQLQVVRDNGKWVLFDDIVVTLSHKYTSKEAEIVILLEKGMAACYQSRLTEAEEMILKAIEMAKETDNSSVLTGRGLHYLSGVYRRMNLTGKAEDCLVKAEQNFHNSFLTLDSTFLAYERASVMMDFISKCPNPKPELINAAKASLLKCISGCMALEGIASDQRYVKKHHFAFIKMAMLLLNCRTASGRKRTVSRESIKEAKESLETLKTRYWDGIAQGEKVQYYLGLADLHFRYEEYSKAEDSAMEAFNMAKKYGFNTEIKPAKDRLEEIKKRYQPRAEARASAEPCCHDYNITYLSETSEGQNGDVSSSESDFMDTPSFV